MTVTPDAMAELRELARAATPGPWHTGNVDATLDGVWAEAVTASPDEDGIEGHLVAWCHSDWRDRADAAYIAAAKPTVILGLLDERDRLAVLATTWDQAADRIEADRADLRRLKLAGSRSAANLIRRNDKAAAILAESYVQRASELRAALRGSGAANDHR